MRLVIPMLLASGGLASAQLKMKVEELYSTLCSGCHGKNFEGGQGGILVDGIWKHGGTDEDIYKSIAKGNLQLGMTPWENVLTPDQIRSLIIFLREKEKQTLAKGIEYPVPSPDTVTKTELHNYRIETIVENGLQAPWAIAFLPDGRKLVTEKPGRLRFVGADGKLDPQVIDGTPPVIEHGQGGLMEVALHPDYKENGWVYLGLSDGTRRKLPDGKDEVRCITAVVRGRIKDHQWTDQQWIYRPDPKFRTDAGVHFGTRFVFDKGYLYFVIGERGGLMQAQDLSRPNGKIHRLHDDGRVPEDNPFVNTPDAIPSIWSYGHRNPQGLTMDPRDGSLYDTEHGPRGGDELNLIQPGNNYGWPVVTLGMNYDGMPMSYPGPDGGKVLSVTAKEGMEPPITFWVPSIAACGLDYYGGDRFPKWKGDLFAGALAQQEIRRIHIENHKVVSQEIILKNIGRVRDVAAGPDGLLYVILNDPDRLVRLVPADGETPMLGVRIPQDAVLITPHRTEVIATGLNVPWELAFLPDGRALFTERNGHVRMIRDNKVLPEPLLEIPVSQRIKMGMLGLAIDPSFAEKPFVYLAYNLPAGNSYELRVDRYRFDGTRLVEPLNLLAGIPAWENHTGCRLLFGPDGFLYVTTGDANRPPDAQQLDRLNGKILRIKPDGTIPAGNPFIGRADSNPAIFSYGHRNSQGLAFQPGTGRLYASEHGPQDGDELNLIDAGRNYGWPFIDHRRRAPGMESPRCEITPSVGPGALLFYQGTAFPELRGTLLMATLRGESVWRFALDAEGQPASVDRLFHHKWGRIRFLVEAPDGSLWLSTSMTDPPEAQPRENNDRIIRIVADPKGTVDTLDPNRPIEQAPVAPGPGLKAPEKLVGFYCVSCHGPGLAGGLQRNLLQGEWKWAKSGSDLERVIGDGVAQVGMPPNKALLTEEQIGIIADHIRTRRSQ